MSEAERAIERGDEPEPEAAERAPGARRWIVSARFDLWILGLPLIASILSLATLGVEGEEIPLWAFLSLIVAFDVAHVWATLYLTYLDGRVVRARPWLLWLPLPLSFLIAYRLHAHSASLFWTLLAYVAIYHFIKQQWGFIALYKARARERSRFDYALDRLTLWAGALGPVMLWHASPARQFDWFNAGESFIGTIPEALRPDLLIAMGGIGATYLIRQLTLWARGVPLNVGKNLWMASAWLSWSIGIGLSDHPLVSAAFLNLFHGIPFLALVWYRSHRNAAIRPPQDRRGIFLRWITRRRRWLIFYALVLLPAILEETLWDGLVWRVYLPELLSLGPASEDQIGLSFWIALLSLPQIVHYFLDAFIWKLDGSNPDLREALELG
ncbi:MAG: hypothetical protein OEY14_01655 [Myxococcales bacterium]|nr:hypothetical protein [Myxococcales bacterium]